MLHIHHMDNKRRTQNRIRTQNWHPYIRPVSYGVFIVCCLNLVITLPSIATLLQLVFSWKCGMLVSLQYARLHERTMPRVCCQHSGEMAPCYQESCLHSGPVTHFNNELFVRNGNFMMLKFDVWLHRGTLGMDKQFDPTFYGVYDDLY